MYFERSPAEGGDAIFYWRQAARGGDPASQYMMGVQYFNGDYLAQDFVEAYAWFSLAAAAGQPEAPPALSMVKAYLSPEGVAEAEKLAAALVLPDPPATAAVAPPRPREPVAFSGEAILHRPGGDLVLGELDPIPPEIIAGVSPLARVVDSSMLTGPAGNVPPAMPPVPVRAPPALDPEPLQAVPPPVRTASAPIPVRPAAAPADRPALHVAKPPETLPGVVYRVQFASLASAAEAAALRETLLSRHAAALGAAGVDVETLQVGGVASYRVRTGPLAGESSADALCAAVGRTGPACQPVKSMRIGVTAPPRPEVETVAPAPAAPAPTPVTVSRPIKVRMANGAPGPSAPSATGRFRVQVGAGRTEEEARSRWSRLAGQHPDLLGDKELFVLRADLGERGVYHRLQVGAFDNRAAAADLCERLKAESVDCFVTESRQALNASPRSSD
jgi:cell division protein FtsN